MKKMSNKAKAAVYTALIVVAFAVLVIAVNRDMLGNVIAIIWLSTSAMAMVYIVYKVIEAGIELNETEREYKEREKKINKRYYEIQISEKENIQVKEKSNESVDSNRQRWNNSSI